MLEDPNPDRPLMPNRTIPKAEIRACPSFGTYYPSRFFFLFSSFALSEVLRSLSLPTNSCLNHNHIRLYMHTWTTSCEALLSLLMWSELETTFTAGARRGIGTSTVANATTLPTRYGTQGPISPLRITTVSFELKQNFAFSVHDQ